MKTSWYEIGFEALEKLHDSESLCVFVAQDERPLKGVAGYLDWRLCGALSRVLSQGFFTGTADDCLLLPTCGRVAMGRVFAIGVGEGKGLTSTRLEQVMAGAARTLSRAKVDTVALEMPGAGAVDEQARVGALVNRFLPEFTGGRVAILADKPFGRLLSGVLTFAS